MVKFLNKYWIFYEKYSDFLINLLHVVGFFALLWLLYLAFTSLFLDIYIYISSLLYNSLY